MNISDFVGLPWRDRGRAMDGCDCWGLLRLVYAARGVALPAYADDYVSAADRDDIARLIAGGLGAWREVPAGEERAFDGVLIREAGVPRHIGMVAGPGLMLHMRNEDTSVIEGYRGPRWRRCIDSFWRHEALA